MAMFIKEIFQKESAMEWVLIASIKFISTWEIGSITHFGAKENFSEMTKYFSKEISKKA